jgi:hypothetical protein
VNLRGATIVELVIALAAGAVLVGALMFMWSGGIRTTQAAQSTIAIQNALLLAQTLHEDLRQLGVDSGRTPLVLSKTSLAFYKVRFGAKEVRLVPVRYRLVRGPDGVGYLERAELRPGGWAAKTYGLAPLSDLEFSLLADPLMGNRYGRVRMKLLGDERPSGLRTLAQLSRYTTHNLVVRVPVPSHRGDPAVSLVARFIREGELPAAGPE